MAAMLCAVAFVVVSIGRIPVFMFLDYEAKDVIITIGGFIMGPLTAALISVIVSFVEMLTISGTGVIGFVMNALGSIGFACTAAYIYKKKHTLSGAVTGLISGIAVMTVLMLLWNYLITPLYMGYSREAVIELLVPVILPFNILKGALNTAITLLIYKPVVTALRKANLIETSSAKAGRTGRMETLLGAVLVIITCIFLILAWRGMI